MWKLGWVFGNGYMVLLSSEIGEMDWFVYECSGICYFEDLVIG